MCSTRRNKKPNQSSRNCEGRDSTRRSKLPECYCYKCVCDTKPVHYLSIVSESLKWVTKTRIVYNVDTQRTEGMKFLRLDHINKYNNEMGGVDLADQLKGSYGVNTWLRNQNGGGA